MATKYWQGQAESVAQQSQAGVTGYDATTTYSVVVGDETIVSTSAAGTAAATVSSLATAWNASLHAYARTVTALATGATLKLTADVAGNPFTVTVSATGGTGAWSAVTTPTTNAGPNDWGTAENWSTDAVPVSTDDVIFRDSDVDVRWGLDQAAVDLASLVCEASYTGKIGLNRTVFVTGSDGSTTTEKPEYRPDYLDIGWDEARIGEVIGTGLPAGSQRLKLDNDKAGASTTTVFNTSSAGADGNLPPVRLLFANANADVFVRRADGGVGIAVDEPGETTTIGDVNISDTTPASRVILGDGVTFTNWTQQGGINEIRAAAGVTLIHAIGGEVSVEGDGYTVTTVTVESGATVYASHTPSAGSAITTANVDGGTLDGTRSRTARTWGTVNLREPGSQLIADDNVVTITTLNEPDGPYTLSVG